MLTTVQINGVDVTDHFLTYEASCVFGDSIGTLSIRAVRTISDVITLATGQTVEVWRGFTTSTDTKIFSGFIEKYEPDAGIIHIECKDKLWDLVRQEVTQVYDIDISPEAGKISAIFQDLVTTFGGLNADSTSIQDSGTTQTLDKFVCNHADVFERCKALAAALDWQFYYRADTDLVYFEPRGFTSNSNTLTVGDNVLNIPQWQYDNTEMANDLTVVGAFQEVETTESGQIGVTTDYNTTDVLLTLEPLSVKVFTDASNPPTTLQTGGVPNSTDTFDYFVDKNQKKIFPKSGTTFTTNDYFETRYSAKVPVPIHAYNQSSIDAYGTFKKTVTFQDIRTMADAEQRGRKHLAKYSVPFVYATLKVKSQSTNTYRPGEVVTVVDNISTPTVNSSLVINRLIIRYPGDYEEMYVGDKEWRLAEWTGVVEERLKRLEEEQFANQDIIVELVDIDNFTSSRIEPRNRYVQAEERNITGTNLFVLGQATYGVLGTSQLGETDLDGPTLVRMIPGQLKYREDFRDTLFKSTGNLNWDTTNRRLSLS